MARKKAKSETSPQAEALVDAHPATTVKELRQVFREAFDTLGGAAWLVAFAQKDAQNARTFVQALSRLIPLELTGKDGGPLTVVIQNADGTTYTPGAQPEKPPIDGTAERVH